MKNPTLCTTIPLENLKSFHKNQSQRILLKNKIVRQTRCRFVCLGLALTYLSRTKQKAKRATQKMNSAACWIILSITSQTRSQGKSSASKLEPNVLLFLSIFIFTPIRTSLYKNLSKTKELQKLKSLILFSSILMACHKKTFVS